MKLNDDTKRIIFVVLAVILFLFVILSLVATRFEHESIQPQHSKALRWARGIISFISMCSVVFWVVLCLYEDWLRSRIDAAERAARMRIVVSVIWWLTIALLILLGTKYLIVLYGGSHRIIFDLIGFVLFSLCFGYFLLHYWQALKYFRIQPLCNIVAAGFLKQHDKFVEAGDFDKAYTVLVKACEIAPDRLWLWCKLAVFCEKFRKNIEEADRFIAKAEELITTNKANKDSDKACYLDYLGLINYLRGESQKGLDCLKQATDIEPMPERIKLYEQMLSQNPAKHRLT